MNIPGEILALMAALFWSIAVVIFKSLSQSISPFLINALKNTIAVICFIIVLSILKIPLWNELSISNLFGDALKLQEFVNHMPDEWIQNHKKV